MANEDLNEYFREQTNERFNNIDKRFDAIDEKLSELLKFKWQIISTTVLFSVLLSVLIQWIDLSRVMNGL